MLNHLILLILWKILPCRFLLSSKCMCMFPSLTVGEGRDVYVCVWCVWNREMESKSEVLNITEKELAILMN